jgi:hypothetical protein
MRRLKAAWDPLNILNPGKVVIAASAAPAMRTARDGDA